MLPAARAAPAAVAAPPSRTACRPSPRPAPCRAQVTVASVEEDLAVTCARQTRILADRPIAECAGESWDLIALPVRGARGPPMRAGWGG